MVNVKKGVLVTWLVSRPLSKKTKQKCFSDPAMKQFLVFLDESRTLGTSFVVKDLDDRHLFIDKEIVPILEQKVGCACSSDLS